MDFSVPLSEPEADLSNEGFELIEEGPASKVMRTFAAIHPHPAQLVVVKSSTTIRRFAKEPHDIVKEFRVLSVLAHPNIIEVWSHTLDQQWSVLHMWEPYIPISLASLLASPLFSPFSNPSIPSPALSPSSAHDHQNTFSTLARSVMYQTLHALAYLHASPRRIAHRDIKPRNILLTQEGRVKLIDFGIAFTEESIEKGKGEEAEEMGYLWPEKRPKMYFEVSTGPYRAPELLFGTRNYDAFAIDLWSLGATFAEFFTPLRLCPIDDDFDHDPYNDNGEEEEGDEDKPTAPFIVPRRPLGSGSRSEPRWERDTLFSGSRGELGLAWSIFRVRGTPTPDTWPAFFDLPDSQGVEFTIVPGVSLASLLPNLPPSHSFPALSSSPLDLIDNLLLYPVESRLSVDRALGHGWFTCVGEGVGGGGVLVPNGYAKELQVEPEVKVMEELEGCRRTLRCLLRDVLG